MLKQLGELKIHKSDDYYGKIVEALENAGFAIILTLETSFESYYIVADKEEEE